MDRHELLARLNAPPPPALEHLAHFLRTVVAAAENMSEVEADLRASAGYNPLVLGRYADAIEAVLQHPPPAGTLAKMVAWDGNWVLHDATDAGAAEWLAAMADSIRRMGATAAPPVVAR